MEGRINMGQDLRTFLKHYEESYPKDVIHINDEIDGRYETTALIMELEKAKRYPVVFFNKVKGHDIPVVANVLASRQRMGFVFGVAEKQLPHEYAKRINIIVPPVLIKEAAPFSENYIAGEDVDLYKLPILTHFPIDAGPYITGGLVVAKDPVTGVDTCGYHRLQLKGRDKLGISLHSRKRMWEFFRRAEEMGKDLEAAIVLGVHPAFSMGSQAIVPLDQGKYARIGGLLGEGVQLANCRSIDVQVPFWSEIVIEGHIMAKEREKEGPFAEFTNYASNRSTENVFKLKAISFKNKPVYQSVTGGMCAEHNLILAVQREGDLLKSLNEGLPNVREVNVPLSGCGLFHCYISLKKTAEGQPLQAILKALSLDHNLKLVVVVDEDVDIFNESEVLWAMATRMQASRDVIITPQNIGMGCILDPSSDESSRSSKMGIDATKPSGWYPNKLYIDPDVANKMKTLLNRVESI
jgi:UbiD family decarboxylase